MPTLQVIAPDPKRHIQPLLDLICKTFGNYFDFLRSSRDAYVLHSHYDYTTSRIGLIGDEIVTHFGVWDYTMRIGTARVRCGGIGAVSTHLDYRKRGYMEQTAPASVAAMRAAGYDFSILFGIWNFYHHFGYTRAWNEITHKVRVGDLPKEPPARPLHRFAFGPREDLAKLFNRFYATATGSAVRPTYSRPDPRANRVGFSWNDARGKIAGYIAVVNNGNRLFVDEVVGDTQQTLRAAAQVARRFQCDEVLFPHLPYETDLARTIRAGTCTVETQRVKCGGPMVRTINLAQALSKMAPELSRRLKASPLADYRGELLVTDPTGSALLTIDRGQVATAPPRSCPNTIKGGPAIAQLLLGTDPPSEIVAANDIAVRGDAKLLLPLLFPDQHPTLQSADRY